MDNGKSTRSVGERTLANDRTSHSGSLRPGSWGWRHSPSDCLASNSALSSVALNSSPGIMSSAQGNGASRFGRRECRLRERIPSHDTIWSRPSSPVLRSPWIISRRTFEWVESQNRQRAHVRLLIHFTVLIVALSPIACWGRSALPYSAMMMLADLPCFMCVAF